MKRLRIYVDTSVFGGCADPEFAEWSTALMDDFRADHYGLIISEVTRSEIALAPEPVRELFAGLVEGADSLPVTPEAIALLRAYESHRILGSRFRNDMLHIAIATAAEVDVLVS